VATGCGDAARGSPGLARRRRGARLRRQAAPEGLTASVGWGLQPGLGGRGAERQVAMPFDRKAAEGALVEVLDGLTG
jgi:hypothetical protein